MVIIQRIQRRARPDTPPSPIAQCTCNTDAFAHSIMLALFAGGLTYVVTCMRVHSSPGVRMFRFSLPLSLYSSSSLCLLATLSPSFSPSNVRLSRVSDEELIAPESLALLSSSRTDGRDVGRSSLFARTWLPVSSPARMRARARIGCANTHIRTVLPAARGEPLGTESARFVSRVKDVGSSRATRL